MDFRSLKVDVLSYPTGTNSAPLQSISSMMDRDMNPKAIDEKSEFPAKKRRGRPPKDKSLKGGETPAPQFEVEELSELRITFNVVQRLISLVKLKPLRVEPSELMYGLSGYRDVIELPMWLLEISRKYEAGEYEDGAGIGRDLRLILENCYRFWGPAHKFAQIALKAERVIIKSIAEFPYELRAKFCKALYDDENYCLQSSEESCSRIFQNLAKAPGFARKNLPEAELLAWEKEVLLEEDVERQIKLMPELAEIGQFLSLAKELLNLKTVPQYEIERMLMMPKESTSLATIMTSFLCPRALRPSLYFKPLMVYDVWVVLLKKKLDVWYNAYAKYHDRLTVFTMYGVEPNFFEQVGEINPLNLVPFHELTFVQKVAILKAFCMNIFHSEKTMEDFFTNKDPDFLRPSLQFSDSDYCYTSLFSPEIRIYRTSKKLEVGDAIRSLYPNYRDCDEKDSQEVQTETEEDPFLNKQTFYLVAQNVAGLKKLSQKLSKKKGKNKKSVKSVVSRLLLKSRSVKNPDVYRGSLYNQWREPINSDPAFVEVSNNYWLTKATKDVDTEPTEAISEATPSESQAIDQPRQPELGKRTPRKRQQTTDNAEVSSLSAEEPEAENEDVSDWEQSRKPKRPRPFRVKRKFIRRTKKQLEFDRQNCSAGNDPEKKTRGRKRTSLPQTETGLKNGWKSIYAQKPMELFDEPYTPSMDTINIADIKTEDETERGAAPISTEWGPLAPVTLAPVPKSAVSSNALGDGSLLELGTVIKREKSPGSGPDVGQGPASLLPALKAAAQGSGPSKVQPRTHFITGNPKIPVSKQGPSNQHVAQRGPLNLSASRSATNSRKPSVNKIQTESTGNTFYQNPFLTNTPCKPFRAPAAQHSFPSLPHRNIGPALPRMRGGCHPAAAPFLVSRGAGHFVQQQPWVPEYRPKPSTSGMPNLAQYHRINVPAQHNVFLQGPLCFIPAVSGGDVVILASNPNAPVPQMPVPQYQLKPHPDLFVKHVPKPSAVPRVHQNMVFQVASNPVKAAPSAPVLPVPTELFLNVPIAPTRSHDVPASQTNAPPPLIEPKDVSLAYWVADFAKAFHPMDFGICWAATDFSQILV